jgi:ATP-dependent RNA helicase MRH4
MRTYSRRSSDKENEGEGEDNDGEEGADDETFDQTTDSVREVFAAEELQQAAKKFKEVDKWELDFEEVVQSSSPAGAR